MSAPHGIHRVPNLLNRRATLLLTLPLIPLLENHQTKDGRVRIPKALRPYIGGKEFIG